MTIDVFLGMNLNYSWDKTRVLGRPNGESGCMQVFAGWEKGREVISRPRIATHALGAHTPVPDPTYPSPISLRAHAYIGAATWQCSLTLIYSRAVCLDRSDILCSSLIGSIYTWHPPTYNSIEAH